jgi:hypothetical protein
MSNFTLNWYNTVRDGPLGVIRRPLGNVELLTLTLSFPCNRNDGEWFVGSGPWGNVELLTLTLLFPSNRKRYNYYFIIFQ